MIEVLILNLKRGEMLIHEKRNQLMENVVRNIWVNALLGLIVVMVVKRVAYDERLP